MAEAVASAQRRCGGGGGVAGEVGPLSSEQWRMDFKKESLSGEHLPTRGGTERNSRIRLGAVCRWALSVARARERTDEGAPPADRLEEGLTTVTS